MPDFKEFICLANSTKLRGKCVAGKVIEKTKIGQWIRPVKREEYW